MYRQLGTGILTTGEPFELGVVEAPDLEWADRVVPLLVHKGGDWNYQISASLAGPLDDLETRFYVGHIDGLPITTNMVVGARGAGILGHVFTVPRWRQRGAYRQLMTAQMEDIRRLGFRILTLGTGYNSHPYWIYHSFGFRSVAEGSGEMCWLDTPETGAWYLNPGPAEVRPVLWSDWAAYNFATLQPIHPMDALPRSPALDVRGQGSVEGPFIGFQRRLGETSGAQSRMLQSQTGAIVGWCHLVPGPAMLGDGWLLDLNVRSGFESAVPRLFEGLVWPGAPVAFVATPSDPTRSEVLRQHGFRRLASLPGLVQRDPGGSDPDLWLRY